MNDITASLQQIRAQIQAAEHRYGRTPGSVVLLAVSKTHPPEAVKMAYAAGQRAFGENYLQDALTKITSLASLDIDWHFIGPIQSNKTRDIAQHFSWVHTLERERIARRLDEQRPPTLAPLNVCIQVNVSGETTKSGLALDEVSDFAQLVESLPNLALRGLMTIPRNVEGLSEQREQLSVLRLAYERLQGAGHTLDTLSMGMTDDLEAAIAEGSTMVRIGTAIFGARRPREP
jgi:pyridoxal phosphate enzyme (YggS family)